MPKSDWYEERPETERYRPYQPMRNVIVNGREKAATSRNAQNLGVNQVEVTEENVDYNRIYEYNDLSFCVLEKGNREINKGHIRSIYKNMDENMLCEFRVDVKTKVLLDGYHRYEAVSKFLRDGFKLTKPIRVIYEKLKPGQTVVERIIELNNGRKNWTTQDYIMSRKSQGDKYANELEEFCLARPLCRKEKVDKKTGIKSYEPIMRYGGWFIKGGNCSPLFKKGNYVHTKSELETGKAVYDEIVKIMAAADITKTGTWFGEFIRAWRQVREEQKDKIAALPAGFESLIPEFEKQLYVREETLVNQVNPNMRNLESVIDDAVRNLKVAV